MSVETNVVDDNTSENITAEQITQIETVSDDKYAELVMSNIVSFGRYSLELEEKREQSLINQSSQMITAFSVFSIAIFTLLPVLTTIEVISIPKLFFCVGLVAFLLVVSLVLALLAQWRYKYSIMQDVDEFDRIIQSELQSYLTQVQFDMQWKEQLSQLHKSLKKKNDYRAKFVKASMIVFFISVATLLISTYFIIFTII
jgi:hypothetical protein